MVMLWGTVPVAVHVSVNESETLSLSESEIAYRDVIPIAIAIARHWQIGHWHCHKLHNLTQALGVGLGMEFLF